MAAPLLQDLGRRLVLGVEGGGSAACKAARIGGDRTPLLAGHEELLRALTTAKPNTTLAGIQARRAARGSKAGCPKDGLVHPAQARAATQCTA